jgi:hypothetical protein
MSGTIEVADGVRESFTGELRSRSLRAGPSRRAIGEACLGGGCQVPSRPRAAWTMCPAEIPAASMSSAGVPEPGRPRTARWVIWAG